LRHGLGEDWAKMADARKCVEMNAAVQLKLRAVLQQRLDKIFPRFKKISVCAEILTLHSPVLPLYRLIKTRQGSRS
jgi:hypothetical protein